MKNISILFIIFCYVLFYCSNNTSSDRNTLPVLDQFTINVPEPSGLSFGKDFQSLWVVSDNPDNRIYEIDLTGAFIQKLAYIGDDLEGIAYDSLQNVLWVVEEQKREIVKLNMNGGVILRIKLNAPVIDDHGFEGIAINSIGNFWIANEKSPRKIFVYSQNFTPFDELVPENTRDFSGLEMDEHNGRLWILSDESEKLLSWNILDGTVKTYNIPVPKAEGIAINPAAHLIYIVSDEESKMYVFDSSNL